MDLNRLRKEASPFKIQTGSALVVVTVLFAMSWRNTEMSLPELFQGWHHMQSYMAGNPDIAGSSFFPPSFIARDFTVYLRAMFETIEMAVVALVLSVLLAFPLSLLASRNILKVLLPGRTGIPRFVRRSIYVSAMLLANVFRSINEIVWALLFISAIGLGPMAGILALAIHTGGVLTKLLAEGNEAIDPGPVEAIIATGASFPKVILYAVLPQTMPHFVSMVLYRFESDVRSASILGFVGAGGIGFYLFDKIRAFENGDVSTIILIIVATVWCIDKASAVIRRKYI
ncbi:MAG: phosphonate ABC transporter, permease protein PhnE [Proteobacteria bacterium]|nr:phosphonate ABC transporter, permease protein PhnE [Pseudomonadota bacterium]MBU1455491.1 phosphonate ABC transporter, permease protein PhnE [Pseudomonadota bacterium]